jgi:hypothetical protein
MAGQMRKGMIMGENLGLEPCCQQPVRTARLRAEQESSHVEMRAQPFERRP